MNLVFEIIILILSIWIIISRSEKKLIPLAITLLCIEGSLLFYPDMPGFTTGRMVVFNAVVFCFMLRYRDTKQCWSSFPFRWQLLFILAVSFIISFYSKYNPDLLRKVGWPVFEFIGSYLMLFTAYAYSGKCTFGFLKNTLVGCTVLLTVVGLINGILRFNPYIASLDSNDIFDFANMYTHRERFRVSSLFSNPFNYGYVCLILNAIAIYLKQTKIIGKLSFCVIFFGTIFGILSCNCRTVIATYVIGVSIYLLLGSTLKRYIVYLLSVAIFYSLAYSCVPIVEQRTDQLISTFVNVKDVHVEGSSLEARATQLTGAIHLFSNSPIVGNGYDYIGKELGFYKQKISQENRKMGGYESVIFKLLIERGIIGIIAYLTFYGAILFYLMKNREYDILLTALGISLLSIYLFFSIATGELLSVPVTLFFLGIIIWQIEIKKVELFLFRINHYDTHAFGKYCDSCI